jgi:hypothetical protein
MISFIQFSENIESGSERQIDRSGNPLNVKEKLLGRMKTALRLW